MQRIGKKKQGKKAKQVEIEVGNRLPLQLWCKYALLYAPVQPLPISINKCVRAAKKTSLCEANANFE